MISDWELWACANKVLDQYGEGAADYVFGRVTALAKCGDAEGVKTWKAIASRVDQLAARTELH